MLSVHAFLPGKATFDGVDEAPSSAASTCALSRQNSGAESPVLSRQNSRESVASGHFFFQDVIKEEPSAATSTLESQAIRVPLAQKRFSIRMHGEEGALDSEVLERPCVSSGDTPARVPFMQKRFAIRMGDDEAAWLPSQQYETREQPREAVINCQAKVSLAQRRFAIRFQDDFQPVWQPKDEQVSKCKVSDLRSLPASAPTVCQEDKAVRNTASLPLAQRRFNIRMQQGNDFWAQEAQKSEFSEQQHENQTAPETFSQRRFAIRMHDELYMETPDVASAQTAQAPLAAQSATQSFSQRLFSARQHEFEV